MKVQYNETLVVTKEVPDHFGYDKSMLGRIVDFLVPLDCRDKLYSYEKSHVSWAIVQLTEAYEKAEKIKKIFDDLPSGVE